MNYGQPASWLIMVAIATVAVIVWMLFCRRTRGLALGLLGIAALGMVFARVSVRPAPSSNDWAYPLDAQQSEILRNQRMAAMADNAFVQKSPDVIPQQSIESLWTKLTAPKINLDPLANPEGIATQRELANAAKVILSASAPGADPFTQGWLINAAKAIMNAAPQAGTGQGQGAVAKAADEPAAKAEGAEAVDNTSFSSRAAADLKVTYPPPSQLKPDWLENPPKLVGNTRRVVVSTDPYSTVEECSVALRENLRYVVHTRVHELALAASGGGSVQTPALDSMGISIEYILSELCPEDDYIETINSSVGEMKRAYALVEFNEAQDRFLLDRWRAYARVQRMEVVGGLSAFAVAVLALVYGLLKVDTWTRGYYTKRLFLGVPAAIIAVVALLSTLG